MKYRITNKSSQEGMISLLGQWVTVAPGEVIYSDDKPGESTGNVRVVPVVTKTAVKATVAAPVNSARTTIYDKKAKGGR